jgi:glucan biosynthesis protein C
VVDERSKGRQYYIDWLRVSAVFLLIPFHSAMLFVTWKFHFKNAATSEGLTAFNSFLGIWQMPLLFVLSGAGTWFALGFRTAREYVRERFFRLFVPLAFGMLAVVPPQVYLERLHKGQFAGSYGSFYPHIFDGIYPAGNFSWHHLWFLAYLIVFSLILLPLFVRFRTDRARALAARLAEHLGRPGRLLLLALPLMVVEATLRVRWHGDQNLIDDWANFFSYLVLFGFGFLLYSHEAFAEAIERQRKLFLGLAVGCVLILKVLDWTRLRPAWGTNPGNMALLAFSAFNTWCWVLAILGHGRRYLNFTSGALRYLTEAALPVYILHQTIILMIGFHVIQWEASIMAKYFIVLLTSFVATLVVYDLVVRRFRVTRFLCGMKARQGRRSS